MRESGSSTMWLYRIAWRSAAIAARRPFHRTEHRAPSWLTSTPGSARPGKQSSSPRSSRQRTPNRSRRKRFASSSVSKIASVVRAPRLSMSTCQAESADRRTANAVSGFHHPRVASPGQRAGESGPMRPHLEDLVVVHRCILACIAAPRHAVADCSPDAAAPEQSPFIRERAYSKVCGSIGI